MSDNDYKDGMKDGLREALAILAAEEAKWAEKMERRSTGRTLQAQAIRRQAFKTAQVRVQTVLNKREKTVASSPASALGRNLAKLGL